MGSQLFEILTSRACAPEKTDVKYPLRRRFSKNQSLVVVVFHSENEASFSVATAAAHGFEVETTQKFVDVADPKALSKALRSYAEEIGVNYVLAASVSAEISLIGDSHSDEDAEWIAGKERALFLKSGQFSQSIKFGLSHKEQVVYEEIIEKSGLKIVRFHQFYFSILKHLLEVEPDIPDMHDILISTGKGAFFLESNKGEWIRATARNMRNFSLPDWLARFASQRDPGKPVCVISAVDINETVKNALGCKDSEIKNYSEDFFTSALTEN